MSAVSKRKENVIKWPKWVIKPSTGATELVLAEGEQSVLKAHWVFAIASSLSEQRKAGNPALNSNNGLFRLIEPILTPLENAEKRNLRDMATGFLSFVRLDLSVLLLQGD